MANPYVSLLQMSWRYARRERRKMVLVYIMFVCANVIFSLNPILYGWFIDKIQRDTGRVLHFTWLFVGGYFGLKFLQWCFHGPARIMERSLAFNLSRNFLQERYHQVLHLPVKWHQDHHSGATINRIRKAYEALREFFDRGFMFIYVLGKFFFGIAAILYFSPFYGSIALLIGLLTIFVIRTFNKPFIKALDEANEAEHIVSATLFDSLSNIMTVITLRLEKSMETGLLKKLQRIFPPFRRSALINEWKWFTAEMLILTIYGVVTVGYVYQQWVPGKTFHVGGLVTLLAYVIQFTSVFQDIAWLYTDIMQYNTNIQTASLIDEDYKKQHRADQQGGLPENWKELIIANLDFSHRGSYDDKHAPHSLHGLHLRIRRGHRIALIGASGSGKSTLLSLLRGLYTPEPGLELKLDGRDYDLGALNEAVTLFPQEPEIFENTIAYNVTLGLPFPAEEIMEVCENAHFAEVIRELPQGLESDIREKGVNLSGGQKQRLALARGILAARDSDLVLLDEPTSSVDPRTEAMIYQALFKTFEDKAIVSSMHRLHLLNQFDYIYVLDHGRIADEGGFEYLRDNSPVFQELWRHQKETAHSADGGEP
jgi:ATP-binding cassette subfamily B protein